MTFFYLTNFSYVKTVLTIWSVSQFAIFKNMHVFADPITYIYHAKSRLNTPVWGSLRSPNNMTWYRNKSSRQCAILDDKFTGVGY